MNIQEKVEEIIYSKENFPRMLRKNDGELLKIFFELDESFKSNVKDKTDIERRYIKIINSKKYSLLEEFLFKENDTSLNINNAVGVNYYLYKFE